MNRSKLKHGLLMKSKRNVESPWQYYGHVVYRLATDDKWHWNVIEETWRDSWEAFPRNVIYHHPDVIVIHVTVGWIERKNGEDGVLISDPYSRWWEKRDGHWYEIIPSQNLDYFYNGGPKEEVIPAPYLETI